MPLKNNSQIFSYCSYAQSYLLNKPPPFLSHCEGYASKKLKMTTDKIPDILSLIKCCYYFLKSDASFFKDLWNWSEFVQKYKDYSDNDNMLLKVYANHIIAMLTNMNSSVLHKLNENIPEEILITFEDEQESLRLLNNDNTSIEDTLVAVPDDNISLSEKFSSIVTNIEGVFLPIFNQDNYEFYRKTEKEFESIVRVESTRLNLRSIALGITSGKAICLSGPVGCGKTTLVEYLARLTGRIPLKKQTNDDENTYFTNRENKLIDNIQKVNDTKKRKVNIDEETIAAMDDNIDLKQTTCNGFLRIQLGDQTDSKMLLGQYHCTDVPGEFIWLPGVLTQVSI